MMIEIANVTNYGQIKKGEVLVIERSNGIKFIAVAKEVIRKGTDQEEVVICKSRNDYFIMSLMLDGKSWVKNVSRLIDVKIISITNNLDTYESISY